jgi:hypothetical protein
VPIQAFGFGPLVTVAEVVAHEEQLLARVSPHVAKECAERRELLPRITRHAPQQAAFAVDNFVM